MTIQNLHNLVHQLTAHEHTLIRYALKGSKDDDENKSLQLFEFLITQNKNVSRSATSLAVYNAPPDTRINKLINRLWEKVLDIITSDSFLRKNERLSEQYLLRLRTRKKMLQSGTLIYLNGSSESSNLLIEDCILDAKKTESNILLTELFRIKKSAALFHNDTKEYDFCSRQIAYYLKCSELEQKILHYYYELTKENSYGNSKSPAKKLESVERVLYELKKERKYMNSIYSQSLYGMIRLEWFYLKENYTGAKRMLKQHLSEIGSSFMAGGRANVHSKVEGELGTCELFLGNYDKAVAHLEKGAMLWGNDKLNYFITLGALFPAVFYTGDFNRAGKIISELLSDQNPLLNNFRTSKPHYYQACIHFKRGEFTQALKIINKPMPLNKDKTGYDIAVRTLRIQCLLVLERFDEASAQIENLRKHVSRNNKKTYTSKRNMLITRLLILMQKRGFAGKPNKTEAELIKKLSASTGKYKWNPMTPELIRFHEWYAEIAGKNQAKVVA